MPGMMDTVLNIGLNDETVAGMVKLTGNPRFVYDSYRRLIQMFGSVVMDVPDEPFEQIISEARRLKRGVRQDVELNAEEWQRVIERFKGLVKAYKAMEFPQDPYKQLEMATRAVFNSWFGKRAVDYRNATGISHDLGTAVNIQMVVFGNMGDDSGTGVAFTRNPVNGEREIYGDYLINAQGEDVVAGIRNTLPILHLQQDMPAVYEDFVRITNKLESHFQDMQDVEFTIERGKLWLLQTRDGKRTARAAIQDCLLSMATEGLDHPRTGRSCASSRTRWTCCCTRSSPPRSRTRRAAKAACSSRRQSTPARAQPWAWPSSMPTPPRSGARGQACHHGAPRNQAR
jgi:pyruvate,orthophosphate dikinase